MSLSYFESKSMLQCGWRSSAACNHCRMWSYIVIAKSRSCWQLEQKYTSPEDQVGSQSSQETLSFSKRTRSPGRMNAPWSSDIKCQHHPSAVRHNENLLEPQEQWRDHNGAFPSINPKWLGNSYLPRVVLMYKWWSSHCHAMYKWLTFHCHVLQMTRACSFFLDPFAICKLLPKNIA